MIIPPSSDMNAKKRQGEAPPKPPQDREGRLSLAVPWQGPMRRTFGICHQFIIQI